MTTFVKNNHETYEQKKAKEVKINIMKDSLYSMYIKELSEDIIPLEVQLKRFKSTHT